MKKIYIVMAIRMIPPLTLLRVINTPFGIPSGCFIDTFNKNCVSLRTTCCLQNLRTFLAMLFKRGIRDYVTSRHYCVARAKVDVGLLSVIVVAVSNGTLWNWVSYFSVLSWV